MHRTASVFADCNGIDSDRRISAANDCHLPFQLSLECVASPAQLKKLGFAFSEEEKLEFFKSEFKRC